MLISGGKAQSCAFRFDGHHRSQRWRPWLLEDNANLAEQLNLPCRLLSVSVARDPRARVMSAESVSVRLTAQETGCQRPAYIAAQQRHIASCMQLSLINILQFGATEV